MVNSCEVLQMGIAGFKVDSEVALALYFYSYQRWALFMPFPNHSPHRLPKDLCSTLSQGQGCFPKGSVVILLLSLCLLSEQS